MIWTQGEDRFRAERDHMVRTLEQRGVRDARVLQAFREVRRELFVPEHLTESAYADSPLPIGHAQTISQPHMVAVMLEALDLQGEERVLDVGAGSGYQSALLSRLAREVYAIELLPDLARMARNNLARAGVDNVRVYEADGSRGLPDQAPFQAIVVGAGATEVPIPLVEQLDEGGRLVIPVGESPLQVLTRIRRRNGELHHETLGSCAFVPLVSRSPGSA